MRTISLLLCAVSGAALGGEAPLLDQRTSIHVIGTAHAEAAPDKVDLHVLVSTVQPTVDAAMAENARLYAQMLGAARTAGIAPADIQLSGVNVTPAPEHDDAGRLRSMKYTVNKALVVCLRDPTKLDPLLLGLSNAKAQVSNITFSSSALRALLPGLPQKAMENARANADALAAALRSKAGRPLKASAVRVAPQGGFGDGAAYSGAGGASLGEAGTGARSADAYVEVDFELIDDAPKTR